MSQLQSLDNHLLNLPVKPQLVGISRFVVEFVYFGIKQARACLFAGLFFLAVFIMPRTGVLGVPRYDALLILAIAIQVWMIWGKLESIDELKAICLFHCVGLFLELFKTSNAIQAWSYTDFAYTKIGNVPLFSGFMYAAVGSYMIQSWRLLDLRVKNHPPYWLAWTIAILIYANFFTRHAIGDFRWYIAAAALGIYARTTVDFRPIDRWRTMPLILAFVLIGFFVWLAENISTFFGIWKYPHQMGAWDRVHLGTWSSWSLLVVMTFTIVANLKHIKERIHIPR